MLIAILIALVLIVIIALISSIRFRFRFDETKKSIGVSYIFVRLEAEFGKKIGSVYLLGMPVYHFPLELKRGIDRKKKEPAGKVKLEKPKRSFLPRGFQLGDLKLVGRLLGRLRTRYLALTITGGFGYPFETGKVFGYYAILQGIFPSFMSHITFNPDFSKAGLQFKGRGLIYVRVYHLVAFAVRYLIAKRKSKLGEKHLMNKKGVSYAQ